MRAVEEIDLRRNRAMHITAAVMQELQDVLPEDALPAVHARLFDCFYENGMAFITDEEREKIGVKTLERRV